MSNQPKTKIQKDRAEVCSLYALFAERFPIGEAIENYDRWGSGHGIDGDMLNIGAAYNASTITDADPISYVPDDAGPS